MSNEYADRAESMLEDLHRHAATIAAAAAERAALTATASTAQDRVTVTVNADGVVIRTQLAPTAASMSLTELAESFTAATQDAAGQVQRESARLLATVTANGAPIPKLSDIVADMPELSELLPDLAPASFAAPTPPRRDPTDADAHPMNTSSGVNIFGKA
ncbi:YbaB/EbfC family nucleoid-associated protein [Nocardia sp. NPDC058518]|uniref:YbaB/EbfC family nucleoid-associated protein n=1 Tax=Nocardia sp. NPDC058518 TaxID=3346534 RepID=UPI00366209A9